MKRWLSAAVLVLGCSGSAPKAPPVVLKAPPPPPPVHTDAERIDRIVTTPGFIWGLTREGPIRWNRQTGQAVDEGQRGAPADATAIAAGSDALYVGTPAGLAWQDRQGRWARFDEPPARAGVIDLEPRQAGGVWMATPNALVAFESGRGQTRADRYRIRDITRDGQGNLWVATQGHGVVALQGQTWVEHTTAQGVCGNHVRHVAVSTTGRLVATCAETPTLAVRDGGRWSAYRLSGVGATLLAAWPRGGEIIVRTPARWFRMRLGAPTPGKPAPYTVASFDPSRIPAPAPPSAPAPAPTAPPSAVPVAVPPSVAPTPVKVVPVAVPPSAVPPSAAPAPVPAPPSAAPPAPPSRYPASAPPAAPSTVVAPAAPPVPAAPSSAPKVIIKPPPVPMPPPIVPPANTSAVFKSVRAGAAIVANPPVWRLEEATDLLPAGGTPSASTVTPDGTLLHALPYRGIVARSGATQRRYVTSTLLPAAPSRLEVDQAGRLVVLTAAGKLLRFDGQRFSPWRLPADARAIGIVAGNGPAYALAWSPAPPKPKAVVDPDALPDSQVTPAPVPARLIIYRSDTQGPFTEVTRLALPMDITDPIHAGRIQVNGASLSFPLFTAPSPTERRAVGLVHVRDAFARLEIWKGRLGYVEGAEQIYLPDAWVNALALAPNNVQYVATNAGLVKVEGRTLTVYDENAFIDSEVIVDVAVDTKGAVWAGTLEGLGTLAGGEWKAVTQPGLDGKINAVATTQDGSVWVGTPVGLWQRTPAGVWQPVRVQGRQAVEIRDMVPTGKGGLWLLTGEGLVRRD